MLRDVVRHSAISGRPAGGPLCRPVLASAVVVRQLGLSAFLSTHPVARTVSSPSGHASVATQTAQAAFERQPLCSSETSAVNVGRKR